MKKIIYFFVGCVLLGFAMAFIFSLVPVFTTSANGFFMSLKHDKYEEAYEFMSDQFKSQYDVDSFRAMVKKAELNQFAHSEWVKSFTNDKKTEGYLMGTITTSSGKRIPLKIYFVATGSGWLDRGWSIQTIELTSPKPEQKKNQSP